MTDENNIGTVLGRSLQEEMQTSYMEYAMSVIISRALPDVRDGLKPVQRRILYAMHRAGATSGSRYRKCAAFVGDVNVSVGYWLSEHWAVRARYTAMWVSGVAFAPEQMSFVNRGLKHDDSVFLQGLSAGLEARF